jgi:protein TonB
LSVVLVLGSLRIPRRYVISAVVHAAVLAGWAYAPARTTRFEFKGDAMTVGLVAAPPAGGGARAVSPAPVPPAPAPVPAPPPEPEGPSLQPEPKPEPKEPKKKKEEKKEEKRPPAPSPGTEGAGAEPTPGPAVPGSGSGGAGSPGTTLSLGAGLPGSDFYSATVRAAIEPRWRKPVLDGEATSEVTVGFEILRDGTVRDVQVVRTSGIPALDRSAMRAVIEASPLPPFPAGWRGASAPATMTFILRPE